MNRIAVLGTGDAPVPNSPVPDPILAAAGSTQPALVDVPGAVFPASPEAASVCAAAYLDAGLAAERAGFAGLYINTVGDYGLAALRSAAAVPVGGAGEGAIRSAQDVAERFAIVTIWPPALGFIYEGILGATGTAESCAAVHHVSADEDLATLGEEDNFVAQMQACGFTSMAKIRSACEQALERDGAQIIILGCTCMHPTAALLQDDGIPVIEPMAAGYRYLESLLQETLK